jgi:hypothetical protein
MGRRRGSTPPPEVAVSVRGTLVLWGVALALGAYLWRTRSPAPKDVAREPPGSPGAPLLAFRPEDARALVITWGEGTLRLSRGDSGWHDGRDRPWPAPALADTVLATLAGARAVTLIEEAPEDLGNYGLDPPRRSITVVIGGGSLTLLVGDRNPAWTGVYARVPPTNRVVLVGSVLLLEIDKLLGAARQADLEGTKGNRHRIRDHVDNAHRAIR